MGKGLNFADRNNSPYDFNNEEYDESPENLVEPESAPYPDIPEELPGVETAEDYEGVTPALIEPEGELTQNQRAEIAARNSAIIPRQENRDGPELIEPDDDPEDPDDDDDGEVEVLEVPQNEADVTTVDDDDDDADFEDGADEDGDDDALQDQGAELQGQGAELEEATAEEEPLGRGRRRKVASQFLIYPGENVFAMYQDDAAEQRVDEYMHSMISERSCAEVDSYLPAVFEFIVTQFGVKSAIDKARNGSSEEVKELMVQHCMSQYSLKAGLKKFGKKGEAAVTKELGQFHDLSVFVPVDGKKLSREERKAALASLIFLKEKRDGTVKARACADGRKQRETTAEDEAASPTVSIESVFMTCAIEAKEKRDVAVMDLPGAFLHADCEDHVIMKFQGRLAELMAMAAPQIYRKYITTDSQGESVLFVKLQKALYGMLKSALLFYKKLLTDLIAQGFTVNPYDPCVVTKTINGKQMTICWHVDDLKVSHQDHKEVTKIEEWLRSIYGNVSVSRGKKHTYLGMQLEYTEDGECKVGMIPYTKEIISSFPEVIVKTSTTSAADHLFRVREDPTGQSILPEEQASAFHRTTAQLLFLSGRARRDIQVAVAFLTTRVKGFLWRGGEVR
jgi:hypothetical protein